MLEDVDLSDARGVLVHIVAGMDFSLDEYHVVGDAVKEFASDDSQIIYGVTVNPELSTGEFHVTLIVTGLGERKSDLAVLKKPVASLDASITSIPVEESVIQDPELKDNENIDNVVVKPEANYLDIPAFLRKQAD